MRASDRWLGRGGGGSWTGGPVIERAGDQPIQARLQPVGNRTGQGVPGPQARGQEESAVNIIESIAVCALIEHTPQERVELVQHEPEWNAVSPINHLPRDFLE